MSRTVIWSGTCMGYRLVRGAMPQIRSLAHNSARHRGPFDLAQADAICAGRMRSRASRSGTRTPGSAPGPGHGPMIAPTGSASADTKAAPKRKRLLRRVTAGTAIANELDEGQTAAAKAPENEPL